MSLIITKENFEEEVMNSNVPVLIDFFAPWCGPCKMVSPVIDSIAFEFQEDIKVGKINVDEQHELAAEFKIMSVPTLAVIKDGQITALEVGAKDKNGIKKMLDL